MSACHRNMQFDCLKITSMSSTTMRCNQSKSLLFTFQLTAQTLKIFNVLIVILLASDKWQHCVDYVEEISLVQPQLGACQWNWRKVIFFQVSVSHSVLRGVGISGPGPFWGWLWPWGVSRYVLRGGCQLPWIWNQGVCTHSLLLIPNGSHHICTVGKRVVLILLECCLVVMYAFPQH